jgi:hypothetical protein
VHPKKRQELRRQLHTLIYYAAQFSTPHSEMVNEIESKIRIQLTPGTTDSDYLAFKAELRKLIEEMLAERAS